MPIQLRTVEACVAAANAATDPAEVERHLVAACAQASDPKDPRLDGLLRRLHASDARGLRRCLAASLRAEMWAALISSTLTAHLAALGLEDSL